jgi:hypothetical protein
MYYHPRLLVIEPIHPPAFRPGLRDLVPRLCLLALASWVVLRLGLQFDVRAATVVTVAALGVMIALRITWRGKHTRVVTTDEALHLSGPDGERSIAWSCVERVRLTAGEITTSQGIVRVCYAHVDIVHGAPLAFADLAPLGNLRLRTVDGDAPVHDIGDPELLLGVIAERVDAREFLPPDGRRAEIERVGPWITASPLAVLRLGVAVMVVHRIMRNHMATDAWMAMCAGVAAVICPHALARFVTQHRAGLTQSEVGAPPAVTVGALMALCVTFPLREWVPERVGAWALVSALLCALPAWPFPGAYIVRRVGRRFADTSDGVMGVLVACLGVLAAWCYARGMMLIPTALVAGGLEAAEGTAASRRHAFLSGLPRFRNWPPMALARLRSALRPATQDDPYVRLFAGDVVELRDASVSPPPGSLVPIGGVVVSVVFAVLAARAMWMKGDAEVREILSLLLR